MSCARAASIRAHSRLQCRRWAWPDVVVDGEVEEADPPQKLVHTYRFLFSDAIRPKGTPA